MFLKQRFFTAEKATAPISIAFLDTGISPVADFTHPQNRIIAFLDLVNGRTDPYDDNGHGTHMPYQKSENPIKNSSERSLPALFWHLFPQLLYNR